jgi:hypothetical protein
MELVQDHVQWQTLLTFGLYYWGVKTSELLFFLRICHLHYDCVMSFQ